MKRISYSKSYSLRAAYPAPAKSLLLFLAFLALPFFGKAQLGVTIAMPPGQPGDQVCAEVLVSNFNDIVSMQWTMVWNPEEYEFLNVSSFDLPNSGGQNCGVSTTDQGILTFSWFDNTLLGVDKPDCHAIFVICLIQTATNPTPIQITSSPVVIEITAFPDGLPIDLIQNTTCLDLSQLEGNIFIDENNNCLQDGGEPSPEDWKVKIVGNGFTNYRTVNANGDFLVNLSAGTYDISAVLPENGLWGSCQPVSTVQVLENETSTVSLPVEVVIDCPNMNVDLAAPFLRRCFDSNYFVNYCNDGTVTADGASVEITFDPFLEVVASEIPWTTVVGNTYTFPLGDVGVGQCDKFWVAVHVSCDAVLGQTHCSSASIFPNDLCAPLPLWDGSNLVVNSTCDSDSVRFEVKNIGQDMTQSVNFIVLEDDMIMLGVPDGVQLPSQASEYLAFPANGSTWRVEVGQTPNHPFGLLTAETVEGCGVNGLGSFSLGFVNQFSDGEENPFFDRDCQENIGAYDPNDKKGYPKGYCLGNLIEKTTDIEYTIRFQNTGTDTAFTVVVMDTLSPFLDLASIQPTVASHDFDFELLDDNVVRFTFNEIMLPDSNVNEAGSHGFVRFRASQMPGNPSGVFVKNDAAIYFDFNEPVITNEVSHVVAEGYLGGSQTGVLSISGFVTNWLTGEPIQDAQINLTDNCTVMTDAQGFYVFPNVEEGTYNITANRPNDKPREGLTVLDLLKMRMGVLFIGPQLTPLQAIAANVNYDDPLNGLTTFDLVLVQRAILGESVTPISDELIFIASDSPPDMPSPTIHLDNVTQNIENQNFIALHPGDVIHESQVETSPVHTAFTPVATVTDTLVKVDIKASDFTTVTAFQFGLHWDSTVMTYQGFEQGELPSMLSTNVNSPSPGEFVAAYINPSMVGINLPPDATLFTLFFKVADPTATSTVISMSEAFSPLQVVVELCKLASAAVTPTSVMLTPTSTKPVFKENFIVKVSPNPVAFHTPVSLDIQSEAALELTAQLLDVQGKVLRSERMNVVAGQSSVTISPLPGQGVFFLKLTDKEGWSKTLRVTGI